MGLIEYGLQKLAKQFNNKGKKSLSARQMAVMTRKYGNDALDQDEIDGTQDDPLYLDDNTKDSKRAKWFGFSNWVEGLFSDDILFSFNGTQIKGKVDHQVRGGAVPLFNGVVLDLKPASMIGRSEEGRQSVRPPKETDVNKPVKGGFTPARLVVSPRQYGFVRAHVIDDFEIEAPKNGEVDVFSATIKEPISYVLEHLGTLEADGAEIERDHVQLENPRVVQDEHKKEFETAEVNGQGISLGKPKVEKKEEEKKDDQKEDAEKKKKSDQEEDIKITRKKKKKKKKKKKDDDDDDDDKKRNFIDIQKGALGLKGEDKKLDLDVATGNVELENDGLEFSGNLYDMKKGFKLGFGKSKSSEDKDKDKDKDKEKTETNTETTETDAGTTETDAETTDKKKTAAIKEYCEKLLEKSTEPLKKLGFAGEAFLALLREGELPPNKFEEEEKDEDVKKPAPLSVNYPIVPGLSFKAELEPIWQWGFHVGLQLTEAKKADFKVEEKNGLIKVSLPNKYHQTLIMSGNMSGKIGGKLLLALAAGIGYLFDVSAGLFAEGDARGIAGKKNVFGTAELKIPITVDDNGMKIDNEGSDILIFKGGLGLHGKVGGEAKAESTLFGWDKELWSYTFAEWEPMELKGDVTLKKKHGGFGERASWQREESHFKFRFFQHTIEQTENYGIKQATKPAKIDLLMEASKAMQERIQSLHQKLEEIEKTISEKQGGQFGTENSEAYKKLLDQLRGIYAYLDLMRANGIACFREADLEVRTYENDDTYKESLKAASDKVDKHEKRKTAMETWGATFGKGEKKGAYEKYKKLGAEHAARKGRQEQGRKEAARYTVATKRNLIAYERKRIKALGQKSDKRVDALEAKINQIKAIPKKEEEKIAKKNKEIVDEYAKKDDKELFRYALQFAGKERIIKYEQDRQKEYKKKHMTRYQDLQNKLTEYGISDDEKKKPNRKFADYYYKDLKAKRFFKEDVLLEHHQSGEEILAYEKARLMSKAKGIMGNINQLKDYKQKYDAAESQEEKDKITKEAKQQYKGKLGKLGQWNITAAKAASKEEILAYEKERKESINKKMPKEYLVAKKVLEAMKRGDRLLAGKGEQFQVTELMKVESIYTSWIKDNLVNTEEGIKKFQEIIPLEVLQQYEQDKQMEMFVATRRQYQYLAHTEKQLRKRLEEKQAALEKAAYRKDISVDSTYGDNEKNEKEKLKKKVILYSLLTDSKYVDHSLRDKYLQDMRDKLENMTGSDKESATQEIKAEYCKKYLIKDGKLNEEGEEILHRLRAGSSLLTKDMKMTILEQVMEEYGDVHEERYKKLREFMGLTEDTEGAEQSKKEAEQSPKTDAQVWDYYRRLGGGRRFADYYAKKKGKQYSIDDMLRYEEYEAKENSGKSALKALIQKKAEKVQKDYTTKEGAEEVKGQQVEKSHYERYAALEKMVNEKKPDKDIVKLYISMGGGAGYVDSLTGGDMLILDLVTPQEILDYESSWTGEKGAVHGSRLEKMEKLDKDKKLTDAEYYKKYREMVLEESSYKQGADKITGGSLLIDFDKSVSAETILTPDIILNYEKKCNRELLGKHKDRLTRLQKDDVTDENAWNIYKEEGGGKGFFRGKSLELKAAKELLGEEADYQTIIDYETSRIEHYKKVKSDIEGAMDEIKKEQKNLKEKVEQAETDMEKVKSVLDGYEGDPPYKAPDKFQEFKEKTTGQDVQNSVAQTADIIGITQKEQEELDRMRAAQVELLMDDDDVV